MTNADLKIRRLLISDASSLRDVSIFMGSILQIENQIRELILDSSKLAYIILEGTDIVCLATMIPTSVNPKNVRLNIVFADSLSDSIDKKSIIDMLLHKGFFDKHLHKISLVIRCDDYAFAEDAIACGMIQEAVLHDEILIGDDDYIDAGLFYSLLPEYQGYNVGFVAFQRGIVAVYGNNQYIDKVSIYRYDEYIDDYLTRSVAKYIGIADKMGNFLPKNNNEYWDIQGDEFLPDEVAKACEQLREYFLKRREKFDINFRFNIGTSFQHSVWHALNEISYGATVSYEDIALKITSDKIEARKLTRAVGAACSENPIPIIVPCHRVIGKDGKLVGYSGGIDIKDFLLQHESLFMTVI